MSGEEWLKTVNQLLVKTRERKLVWRHDGDGRASRAQVGSFEVTLAYIALKVNQEIVPREDALSLSLRTSGGTEVARLDQEQCRSLNQVAVFTALKQLFQAVTVEPRRQAVDEFRQALGEL